MIILPALLFAVLSLAVLLTVFLRGPRRLRVAGGRPAARRR